jgi:hypothetical protein
MVYLIHCLVWNLLLVTAMAAIFWLLGKTRCLRERPALRHSLWLLVLLKFITPPLVPMPVLPTMTDDFVFSSSSQKMMIDTGEATQFANVPIWVDSDETATTAPAVTTGVSSQWQRAVPVVVIAALALILLVFVAVWWIAIRRIRRIRRLTKGLTDTTSGAADVLEQISAAFKLSQPPGRLRHTG